MKSRARGLLIWCFTKSVDYSGLSGKFCDPMVKMCDREAKMWFHLYLKRLLISARVKLIKIVGWLTVALSDSMSRATHFINNVDLYV
jgi:hypothetical protein